MHRPHLLHWNTPLYCIDRYISHTTLTRTRATPLLLWLTDIEVRPLHGLTDAQATPTLPWHMHRSHPLYPDIYTRPHLLYYGWYIRQSLFWLTDTPTTSLSLWLRHKSHTQNAVLTFVCVCYSGNRIDGASVARYQELQREVSELSDAEEKLDELINKSSLQLRLLTEDSENKIYPSFVSVRFDMSHFSADTLYNDDTVIDFIFNTLLRWGMWGVRTCAAPWTLQIRSSSWSEPHLRHRWPSLSPVR